MNLEYIHQARIAPNSLNRPLYSPSAMSPPAVPSQLVYIVNGNRHMRQAVHDHVSSEGLDAVSFESAAEYRAAGRPDVPACLVLDVDLPDLNRFDLQRPVSSMDAPIIFVTNWYAVPPWVRALKAGAVDFLTIPLRGRELLNAVHGAIAMHREARLQHAEMAQLRQRFARLSPREREVLALVNSGMLNKQSALALGISEVTLQIHRRHVMQKMAARSLADLVRMATKLEIPVPPGCQPDRYINRSCI